MVLGSLHCGKVSPDSSAIIGLKAGGFYVVASLLSGEDSPKQLLLINTQLVTRIIKFFD